jgi:shikimate dehydrogenase
MTGMMGHPVAENPIDRMFDAVYAHHGLNWQFWKNDIASEADLKLAVQALIPLGYSGMGITVPYKVAVLPLLDEQEQGEEVAERVRQAARIPAVRWQAWQNPVQVPAGTTLLMNATHLGCAPELEELPLDWNSLPAGCLAVDVITNPRLTPFLLRARERGCPIVDGVEMLVQLAMQIFQAWTGLTPEEAVFQQAVASALGEGKGDGLQAGSGSHAASPIKGREARPEAFR